MKNNAAGQRTHFLPSPDLNMGDNLELEGKHYASFGHEAGEQSSNYNTTQQSNLYD